MSQHLARPARLSTPRVQCLLRRRRLRRPRLHLCGAICAVGRGRGWAWHFCLILPPSWRHGSFSARRRPSDPCARQTFLLPQVRERVRGGREARLDWCREVSSAESVLRVSAQQATDRLRTNVRFFRRCGAECGRPLHPVTSSAISQHLYISCRHLKDIPCLRLEPVFCYVLPLWPVT